MEEATARTIRIGKSLIGLIGLDTAINQAAAQQLSAEDAANFLFDAIRQQNYIPPGAERLYREALRKAYHLHLHPDEQQNEVPVIRIYGKSCVSCDNLHNTVRDVVNDCGLAADIEKIHDPDEIGRSGIMTTPALVINGKLKSSGIWPSRSLIEQWIKELL